MFNGISAHSDLFDKQTIHEINSAFEKINSKVESFSAQPLEPKYATSDIQAAAVGPVKLIENQSFAIEYEKWLYIIIEVTEDKTVDELTEVVTLSVTIPYKTFSSFIQLDSTSEVKTVNCTIEDNKVSIGKCELKKGEKYLLSTSFFGNTK